MPELEALNFPDFIQQAAKILAVHAKYVVDVSKFIY